MMQDCGQGDDRRQAKETCQENHRRGQAQLLECLKDLTDRNYKLATDALTESQQQNQRCACRIHHMRREEIKKKGKQRADPNSGQ